MMRVRCPLTACPATEAEVGGKEVITLEVSLSHLEAREKTTEEGESAVAATNWLRLTSSGERFKGSRAVGREASRKPPSGSPATSTLALRLSLSL